MTGKDVIGRARTGSGKTAAFGLPLLDRVPHGKNVRALVLAPTRELAKQVAVALEEMAEHLTVRVLTIYGGASYDPQLKALKKGVGIVVGTPGRVIDLMDRRALDLSGVEYFVLDEADEMLRMGFIEDVEKILDALPEQRQIALFSASMPGPIRKVANTYLTDPEHIQVEESALTVEHIDQQFIAAHYKDKQAALLRVLAADDSAGTLVFARTRVRCAEVAEYLIKNGVSAEALHGDLNQNSRERVLAKLRAGNVTVVVATDVAARGLDVDHLEHVINFDIPDNAETYTHRIGRTGRAGREGRATTFIEPRDRRRISNFARELGIKYTESQLPTDEEIIAGRRQRLLDRLQTQLESSRQSRYDEWALDILGSGEWSPEDLAASALGLLAKELGLDRDLPSVRGPKPADDGKFKQVNETEVVLTVGRREGVRPGDVVGAIANELNVSSRKIGRISLTAHRTFVGLPSDIAERLLNEYPTIQLRGIQAEVQPNEKDHMPVKKTLRARDERGSDHQQAPERKPRRSSRNDDRGSKRSPKADDRKPKRSTKTDWKSKWKNDDKWKTDAPAKTEAKHEEKPRKTQDDKSGVGGEAAQTEEGFNYIRRRDSKPRWKSKPASSKKGAKGKKSTKGKKRKSNKPSRKTRKNKGSKK